MGTNNRTNLLRSVALLATFLSMIGIGTVMAGNGNPSGAPLVHISYVVNNDEDTGFVGYWALDNYTKTVSIWNIGGPNYVINATYVGTFCTFAGALSPETGAVEPSNACGTMTGGYEANLITYNTPINVSQTPAGSPFNDGGTVADILKGKYSNGQVRNPNPSFDWLAYYFGSTVNENNFSYSPTVANQTAWSWTYTLSNGASWTNAGTGSSGDVISSQTGSGSVQATASVSQTVDTCTVSPSSTGISFSGVVSGASSPTPANPYPVSVENTGNVAGELFLSGTPWFLNAYSGAGSGQIGVSATQWQIAPGPYAGTFFHLQPNTSPQDTGSSIAPSASASVYFELNVPATVPSGTYGQTITLATSC